jgi:hypothetical protein
VLGPLRTRPCVYLFVIVVLFNSFYTLDYAQDVSALLFPYLLELLTRSMLYLQYIYLVSIIVTAPARGANTSDAVAM